MTSSTRGSICSTVWRSGTTFVVGGVRRRQISTKPYSRSRSERANFHQNYISHSSLLLETCRQDYYCGPTSPVWDIASCEHSGQRSRISIPSKQRETSNTFSGFSSSRRREKCSMLPAHQAPLMSYYPPCHCIPTNAPIRPCVQPVRSILSKGPGLRTWREINYIARNVLSHHVAFQQMSSSSLERIASRLTDRMVVPGGEVGDEMLTFVFWFTSPWMQNHQQFPLVVKWSSSALCCDPPLNASALPCFVDKRRFTRCECVTGARCMR